MGLGFSLRLARPDDASQILEIYSPVVLHSAISLEETPPSETEMRLRIEKISLAFPWLVAEDTQAKIIGYAYGSQHRERSGYRWAVDVSAYVHADHRGKGIGKALYEKLIPILKQQNYFRAYAGIGLPNDASIGLHESMGFKKIGHYHNVGFKLGHWHDVGWWELALQDSAGKPANPIKFPDLR